MYMFIFEVHEPPAADILCQAECQTVQQVTYNVDDWPCSDVL